MDKQHIKERFEKCLQAYDKEAAVQKMVCRQMNLLLHRFTYRKFEKVLEIGCGTGLMSRIVLQNLNINKIIFNDIVPEVKGYINQLMPGVKYISWDFIAGDAEYTDLGDQYDLILSTSTFQWFNDMPAFIKKIRASLKPGAILAFSSFGLDNFKEIKALTGNGLTYWPKKELKEVFSAEFNVLTCYEQIIKKTFNDPQEVLHHIRQTGVNAVGRASWTKKQYTSFCCQYNQQFKKDGKCILTYHPIYLILEKPYEQ